MFKLRELQKIILDDFDKQSLYDRDSYHSMTLDNAITGILGARGIGKTTFLLKKAIEHGAHEQQALYISADHVYFLEHTLIDLADQLYKETNVRLLCIDEIHKYPNWQQEVKNIADSYVNLKILFTSSSMIDLVKSKYDLSRRVTLHHLHGFSFREYLEFYFTMKLPKFTLEDIVKNHEKITIDIKIDKILWHFHNYLRIGYYPFFKIFSLETEKYQAIENAIQKTIYEDIASCQSLKTSSLSLIEKLYRFVINSSPGELNAYKLSSLLQKDFESISNYLFHLEQAGVIRFLFPKKSGNAYLRNPSKMYPENSNLVYASRLPQPEDQLIGKVREAFVINQLQNSGYDVFYGDAGDFLVNNYHIEIGGKNKTRKQIAEKKNGIVFSDGRVVGDAKTIPLYLLGFLY